MAGRRSSKTLSFARAQSAAPPGRAISAPTGRALVVGPPRHRDVLVAAALIVAAAFIAYADSFDGAFLLDDNVHVVHNPDIRSLGAAWRHLGDDPRPLVMLSIAINYAVGGYEPAGYHLFNLAVHLIAGLTLFGVLRRILWARGALAARDASTLAPNDDQPAAATWLAGIIALLWIVHPLQTQAVTYIIQRGESMMGMFYLLTVYAALRAAASDRAWPWVVAATLACAAGMLSKPIMVTAPAMVVVVDLVVLPPGLRDLLKRRWPLYLALAATWIIPVSRGVVQSILDTSAPAAQTGLSIGTVSPAQYAMTQAIVILHYLRLCFWPHPLVFDYMWPLASSVSDVAVPIVVVSALVLLTLWGLWRRSLVALAGAWFFLILSPTSSIVPILDAAVEHRMYLSSAAVIALAVSAAAFALAALRRRGALTTPKARAVGVSLFAVVAVALLVRTFVRNQTYHSELAMWTDTVHHAPGNARAQNTLGTALNDLGEPAEAIPHFEAGLRSRPNWAPIQSNLAMALVRVGRIEDGIRSYQDLLQRHPEMTHARMNLALALQKAGRIEDAIREYQTGLAEDPTLVPPRNNLGAALLKLGRTAEAEQAFRTSLKHSPGDVTAHLNLGIVLEAKGRLNDAMTEYRTVLRLVPNHRAAQEKLQNLEARALQPGGG